MLRFEFILPVIYGLCTSLIILKTGVFTLDVNLMLWVIYFVNLAVAFILYNLGKAVDRCLEQLF